MTPEDKDFVLQLKTNGMHKAALMIERLSKELAAIREDRQNLIDEMAMYAETVKDLRAQIAEAPDAAMKGHDENTSGG